MGNPSTKHALVEDVKKEVLAELNRSYGRQREQNLIDNIKHEILMDLDPYRLAPSSHPEKALVERIKGEVLTQLQRDMHSNPTNDLGWGNFPDRSIVESIKKDVIAQIKAERESGD